MHFSVTLAVEVSRPLGMAEAETMAEAKERTETMESFILVGWLVG